MDQMVYVSCSEKKSFLFLKCLPQFIVGVVVTASFTHSPPPAPIIFLELQGASGGVLKRGVLESDIDHLESVKRARLDL